MLSNRYNDELIIELESIVQFCNIRGPIGMMDVMGDERDMENPTIVRRSNT